MTVLIFRVAVSVVVLKDLRRGSQSRGDLSPRRVVRPMGSGASRRARDVAPPAALDPANPYPADELNATAGPERRMSFSVADVDVSAADTPHPGDGVVRVAVAGSPTSFRGASSGKFSDESMTSVASEASMMRSVRPGTGSWWCLGVWRQAWRCIGRLYSQGGVRVFYRGCLINALNSGPAAALTFVAHDLLKETLGLA